MRTLENTITLLFEDHHPSLGIVLEIMVAG